MGIDRDWNSSINIENEGLRKLNKLVDTGRIDFKPVEIGSSTLDMEYFNDIPYVKASLVNEAGSLTALARGSSPYVHQQNIVNNSKMLLDR